jgi:hypothetical protein
MCKGPEFGQELDTSFLSLGSGSGSLTTLGHLRQLT